jgi:hypothetical protein
MEPCPVCSIACVPGWRRIFSQAQRFKCPECAVWIVFRKPRPVPSILGMRIGNLHVAAIVLGLSLPAMLVAFGVPCCISSVIRRGD